MDNVIWVNESDTILGEISRQEAHEKGILHRIVVIYLFDTTGNILIQERKDGLLDHSSAGHVDPGETYLEAAKRELEEELGVKNIDLIEVGLASSQEIYPHSKKDTRHIFTIFECIANPVALQENEVKSVFWDNPLRIYQDMQGDPLHQKYTGGFKASLEYLFEKKKLT